MSCIDNPSKVNYPCYLCRYTDKIHRHTDIANPCHPFNDRQPLISTVSYPKQLTLEGGHGPQSYRQRGPRRCPSSSKYDSVITDPDLVFVAVEDENPESLTDYGMRTPASPTLRTPSSGMVQFTPEQFQAVKAYLMPWPPATS